MLNLKVLTMFAAVLVSGNSFAASASRYLSCSSPSGQIRVSDFGPDRAMLSINTVTLAGPTLIEIPLNELKIQKQARTVIETKSYFNQTICNIKTESKYKVFAQKFSFERKNGRAMIVDDTPQSSPQTISLILLCEERVVDAWPCH